METELNKLKEKFKKTGSLEVITEIIKLEENFTNYYFRSRIYIEQDKLDEALSDLLKALDLVNEDIKKEKNNNNLEFKEDIVYALDYIYSIRKEYDKLTYYNYKNKTVEEVREYLNTLTDTLSDLKELAYGLTIIEEIDEAIEVYKKIIKKGTTDPYVYYNLANLYIKKGQYKDADACFDQTLILDEDNLDYLLQKGRNLEQIDTKQAFDIYNKILNIDNEYSNAYLNRGSIYCYIMHDYKSALNDYNKFIQLEPNNYYGYISRGDLFIKTEKYYSAIEDFDKSSSIDSEIVFSYIKKSTALLKLNKNKKDIYKEIIKLLDKAESLDDDNYEIYINKAIAYEKLEMFERAEKLYLQAIEKFDDVSVKLLLSKFYNKQGRTDEARELLKEYDNYDELINKVYIEDRYDDNSEDKIIAFNKDKINKIEDLVEMTNYLKLAGEYEEALNLYKKVKKIFKNDPCLYFNMGLLYDCMHNFKEAIKNYKIAIKLNKNYASPYINLGKIYDDHSNYKKALKLYLKAKKVDPTNHVVTSNIAKTYFNLKNYDLAIRYHTEYIEMSNDIEGYYDRGCVHFKFKYYEEAIKDIKKCAEAGYLVGTSSIIMATCYYNLKNFKLAKEAYNFALETGELNEDHTKTAKKQLKLLKNINKD